MDLIMHICPHSHFCSSSNLPDRADWCLRGLETHAMITTQYFIKPLSPLLFAVIFLFFNLQSSGLAESVSNNSHCTIHKYWMAEHTDDFAAHRDLRVIST